MVVIYPHKSSTSGHFLRREKHIILSSGLFIFIFLLLLVVLLLFVGFITENWDIFWLSKILFSSDLEVFEVFISNNKFSKLSKFFLIKIILIKI